MVELTQKPFGLAPRGLTKSRKGTILLATACAIAAAGIFVYALTKYRQSVDNGNRPETVFVASSLIQKGTSGNAIAAQQLFKPTTIVAKQVTSGAVADAALLDGKVASTDIYPGQQLTLSQFVPGVGIATSLAPNQRAITVPMQAAPALAGNLAAGDHVDIYVGFTGENGARSPALRLLASNIRVLQAPTGGAGGVASSGPQGGNVTLAVSNSVAPTVMFAADNGKLWMALRPGNASSPDPQEIVTLGSLLLGGSQAAPQGAK
jgi:pilus assembly protein CpaB